jgi:hypothetical protein
MRRIASFSLMAFLFLLLAGPAQAQDVSGDWTLTWTQTGRNGQSMERSIDITLVQEGTTVTGNATMTARPGGRGAGGGAGREVQIEGTMEGDQLTFSWSLGMGQRTFTQSFTATVSGNNMEGTMTGGMRQTDPIPFKGVKKEG